MEDKKLFFNHKNYCSLKPIRQDNPFFSWWFKKGAIGVFLICFTALSLGKIILKRGSYSVYPVREQASVQKFQMEIFTLPSILVNFKTKKGTQTAQITAQLETRYPSLKKKLLDKPKNLQNNILITLSGTDFKKIQKNKSYFENKIRKQMNSFLPDAKIEKVTLHAKKLNQERKL